MFFGNIQSCYRRNSLHNSTPNHSLAGGHNSKDKGNRSRRSSRQYGREDEEDRQEEYEPYADDIHRSEVPAIRIGFYNEMEYAAGISYDAPKEKRDASRYRGSVESDNSVRLGPNKNNIIEETLKSDRMRQKK